MLQTRRAQLEQDLRATQGVLAVLRSKQPRPSEREAFLLEELEKANSDLLCKLSWSPRAATLSISSHNQLLSSSSGAQLDARAETDRVNNRLRHSAEIVG